MSAGRQVLSGVMTSRVVQQLMVGVAACTLFSGSAAGHGQYHELIDLATKRVKADNSPEAYVSRGELYRTHGDVDMALADFAKAGELAPNLATLDLLRGRVLLDGGRALAARPLLERYAEKNPGDATALMYRARVRRAMGRTREAAADFAQAVSSMKQPSPDELLERHKAQIDAGLYDDAQKGLEEGMKKLGPIVTLQLPAIDLDLRAHRWDAALARVDQLAATSPRKETWLLRRGEIQVQAGRKKEARLTFVSALAALAALPPNLRNVPAMNDLDASVRRALVKAGGKAPPSTAKTGAAASTLGTARK